jgi:hypothetical protein
MLEDAFEGIALAFTKFDDGIKAGLFFLGRGQKRLKSQGIPGRGKNTTKSAG